MPVVLFVKVYCFPEVRFKKSMTMISRHFSDGAGTTEGNGLVGLDTHTFFLGLIFRAPNDMDSGTVTPNTCFFFSPTTLKWSARFLQGP